MVLHLAEQNPKTTSLTITDSINVRRSIDRERTYRMQTDSLKPIGLNQTSIILMLVHLCRLVSLSCLDHIPSHRCPPACDHLLPAFRAQSSSSYGVSSGLLLHFAVSELGAGGI